MELLNQDLLPGCYYHRTAVNDVARVENRRSFVRRRRKKPAPLTTGWLRTKCTSFCGVFMTAPCVAVPAMCSPTPWPLSVSPFAKYGIEITDSIYVVLNMIS